MLRRTSNGLELASEPFEKIHTARAPDVPLEQCDIIFIPNNRKRFSRVGTYDELNSSAFKNFLSDECLWEVSKLFLGICVTRTHPPICHVPVVGHPDSLLERNLCTPSKSVDARNIKELARSTIRT